MIETVQQCRLLDEAARELSADEWPPDEVEAELADLVDLVELASWADPGGAGGWPGFDEAAAALQAVDSVEVRDWRNRLSSGTLPADEVGLIDLLRGLEDLKSAACAVQARAAVGFEAVRRQSEADRGVPISRRGVGVGSEVALARRESPHRGGRLMGLARALVGELPMTLQALAQGTLNEWRVTSIARETACLQPADRGQVDAWLARFLVANPAVGDGRLVAEVRRKVIEVDQAAVVRRRSAAAGGRRVSLRPLPDGMVQLTAVLELREGVAVYAALKKAADQARASAADQARASGGGEAAGHRRGRGAVMADALVQRVTGQPAGDPGGVDLTVVITAEALLNASDDPGHVDGYGPVSAGWVRHDRRDC